MECLKPELKERLKKVELWLKDVLCSVPVFEVNEETLDILEQYIAYYDREEEMKKGDIATIEEETKHFQTESDRLSTLLGSLHCDPDKDLESDAAIFSKALHKTAVELNVSKPTLPCCLAAITNLQERSYKVESELDAATDQVEELKSVRDKLEAMKCHIEKVFNKLEKSLTEEKKNYEKSAKTAMEYMEKGGQYNKTVSVLTKEIKENKFSDSIRHEELTNLSCELTTLQNRFAPLKLQLQSYADLPLDDELARRKLIEKKAQLDGMLAQLKVFFDDISLEGRNNAAPGQTPNRATRGVVTTVATPSKGNLAQCTTSMRGATPSTPGWENSAYTPASLPTLSRENLAGIRDEAKVSPSMPSRVLFNRDNVSSDDCSTESDDSLNH